MVIFAEVVCEAFTIWALEEVFKKKNVGDLWGVLSEQKNKMRRLQDICNSEVNKMYTALSGDPITQASFWPKLQEHNKRRNALVHPDVNAPTPATIPSQEEAA